MEEINEFYKSLRGVDLTEEQINNWNEYITTEHYRHALDAYENNMNDVAFHFFIMRNSYPYES